MNILVFGKNGQVARSLFEAATSFDIKVDRMGHSEIDITNESEITDIIGDLKPQFVINAAAYTAVDQAETEADEANKINNIGPACIARVAHKFNLPLIHYSTDYVFDGSKAGAYTEIDKVSPVNMYGQTKYDGELSVINNNPQHIIFRTSWVYGSTGKNFLKTMIRLAKDRDHINVVGDQFGSPTYSLHLAEATLHAITKIKERNVNFITVAGIYNMCGFGYTSWAGLATHALTHSKQLDGPFADIIEIPSSEFPTPALRPMNSRLNTDKLNRVLETKLPSWQSGVEDCVSRILA
ncbi:MAG: dTDP-4-dehydrorhamnose reductase [Lentilitoribacter sp.]